ncbi:MAG: translation elongation factor Ts [Elusimicrobiota bacterium]
MSTELIVKLREKTGAGMMDCKKALTEAGGDMDKAVETLRKKGLADAAKRSARSAKEGLVAAHITPDGKKAGIVELNCETDFVAKTDEFQAMAAGLAKEAAEGSLKSPADAEAKVKGLCGKLGENMMLRRLERFELQGPGRIDAYIHSSGAKKGALVQLSAGTETAAAHDAAAALGKELAMQVVAMGPRWLKIEDIPADAVAKEREIFATQVKAEGKPEAQVPKIVEGKLRKLFFQAFCLIEQMSMRDNKTPIKQLITDASKAAGAALEVRRFARYQLGEE